MNSNIVEHAETYANEHPSERVMCSGAEHSRQTVGLNVVQPRRLHDVAPGDLHLMIPPPTRSALRLSRKHHAWIFNMPGTESAYEQQNMRKRCVAFVQGAFHCCTESWLVKHGEKHVDVAHISRDERLQKRRLWEVEAI
jgi:hypothetical protein